MINSEEAEWVQEGIGVNWYNGKVELTPATPSFFYRHVFFHSHFDRRRSRSNAVHPNCDLWNVLHCRVASGSVTSI